MLHIREQVRHRDGMGGHEDGRTQLVGSLRCQAVDLALLHDRRLVRCRAVAGALFRFVEVRLHCHGYSLHGYSHDNGRSWRMFRGRCRAVVGALLRLLCTLAEDHQGLCCRDT